MIAEVRANPRNPGVWLTLGDDLLKAGERERARECYTRALRLDPNNRAPYQALAALYAPLIGPALAEWERRRVGPWSGTAAFLFNRLKPQEQNGRQGPPGSTGTKVR
ncbi:MAG: tetratricopeptide repeat protein [Ardenticatenales bacterium]|nr:tetratricopeptide repeat protein [Ardenticatenales bacterium]